MESWKTSASPTSCKACPNAADEIVARANHMALYQGMDSKGKVSMTLKDKNGRVRNLGNRGLGFFKRPVSQRLAILLHRAGQ